MIDMKKSIILSLTGLFLLLITPSVLAQCEGQKDCSIYDETLSLITFFQATLCGVYNFLVCIGPPMVVSIFLGVLAMLIVALFGLMAYILSINR